MRVSGLIEQESESALVSMYKYIYLSVLCACLYVCEIVYRIPPECACAYFEYYIYFLTNLTCIVHVCMLNSFKCNEAYPRVNFM
jgi:hypothetical protein